MMESPPPPHLYCISQASPIMGFTPHPVTKGGGPAPLLTMAPWGPKRLRCCTVSMPPPPATPPSSTYTARISLRTQVCICLNRFFGLFTLIHDITPCGSFTFCIVWFGLIFSCACQEKNKILPALFRETNQPVLLRTCMFPFFFGGWGGILSDSVSLGSCVAAPACTRGPCTCM